MIEVATAEQANRLINERLVEDAELKLCELFAKECRAMQCFKCYSYGHMAHSCKKEIACGYCGKNHTTHSCTVETKAEQHKCVNCKENHTTWSQKCKIRQKNTAETKRRLKSRATFYPVSKVENRQVQKESMPPSARPVAIISQRGRSVSKARAESQE